MYSYIYATKKLNCMAGSRNGTTSVTNLKLPKYSTKCRKHKFKSLNCNHQIFSKLFCIHFSQKLKPFHCRCAVLVYGAHHYHYYILRTLVISIRLSLETSVGLVPRAPVTGSRNGHPLVLMKSGKVRYSFIQTKMAVR